ncbi:Shedu immune nuclease family protein [Methylobacterium brachythecii]|uniref:Shedu protein SduA C-terminal domain-containing protein n=1 Tax=Methylobacterium brachythecii TaxID=1176177 RepID=A0A7W6ALW0_9HYPH|nr:Shedu immune nuclease family protein [Methylobacterium brachythecii]MBB3904134.1 hypothetical protein [Methylobacterium brachythecii]GLS42876.1 hypothetical protein GCM10007884_08610 [Methylobacterium brachythecii]
MTTDAEYIAHYQPDKLYTHPAPAGAYATIVGESEEIRIGEVAVTARCRIAVTAFHVKDRGDYGQFKIRKLLFHKTHGWREDGAVQVNQFQLAQMREFLAILSSLDLGEAQKTRVSLENLHVGALGALLSSAKGAELIDALAASPDLHVDIYAVGTKRSALREFEDLLRDPEIPEATWQAFFERNPWIFGHGLNYVFLDKVAPKLEASTTGSSFDRSGKRADGLMMTRAEVSQYVLVEIKRNATRLLQGRPYRSGCWSISDELAGAVAQVQKTVFEFVRHRFRDEGRNADGSFTGNFVHAVEPRSYLVVGTLDQVRDDPDQIASFELFRRNVRAPEILTFGELFHRARCIVENVSRQPAR